MLASEQSNLTPPAPVVASGPPAPQVASGTTAPVVAVVGNAPVVAFPFGFGIMTARASQGFLSQNPLGCSTAAVVIWLGPVLGCSCRLLRPRLFFVAAGFWCASRVRRRVAPLFVFWGVSFCWSFLVCSWGWGATAAPPFWILYFLPFWFAFSFFRLWFSVSGKCAGRSAPGCRRPRPAVARPAGKLRHYTRDQHRVKR